MNYFELYPGDYLKDTGRLTLVDHGAYLRLMLEYYATEEPLPGDLGELYVIAAAISALDKAAVRKVAERFFPIAKDGLRHNGRADDEIAKAQRRMAISRENGSKGGRKKNPVGNPTGIPAGNPAGSKTGGISEPGGNPERTRSGEALQTPDPTRKADTPPRLEDPHPRAPAPSTAGAICSAMRTAGLATANPSHPRLLEAIAAGCTTAEFVTATHDALAYSPPKGFAWIVATTLGRRNDSANGARNGSPAPRHRTSLADQVRDPNDHHGDVIEGAATRVPHR